MNKLLSLLIAVPMFVSAGWSTDSTVGTDYIWRGVSQTQGDPSWQQNLMFDTDNGFYTGLFLGNVKLTEETDIETSMWVGKHTQMGWLGLDLGYIKYDYLDNTVPSFEETYVGVDFWKVNATWFKDMDTDSEYLELGFDVLDLGKWGMEVMHMSDTMDLDMYGLKMKYHMSNKLKVNFTVYEEEQLVSLSYVW